MTTEAPATNPRTVRTTPVLLSDAQAERIARRCREANRTYCQTIGDNSQPAWDDAPQWQKDSAVKGVHFRAQNPASTPADSHQSWLDEKAKTGWVYGPLKDPEQKRHPCMMPYEELPREQRRKDDIFIEVVEDELASMPVENSNVPPPAQAEPTTMCDWNTSVEFRLAALEKHLRDTTSFGS